ncbi:hypothetical protein LEMLEM_LOCUS3206, partial [Lemmus lemmus]
MEVSGHPEQTHSPHQGHEDVCLYSELRTKVWVCVRGREYAQDMHTFVQA